MSFSEKSKYNSYSNCSNPVKEGKKSLSNTFCTIASKATSLTKNILSTFRLCSPYKTDESLKRPKILILGTGWGFMKLSKGLDVFSNDVKVISPNKHFCFTPLLTQIVSNRLPKEVCEIPLSELTFRGNKEMIKHIKGLALDIDKEKKQVIYFDSDQNKQERISYDYLIINVGNENSNIIPGLKENALYLKNVEDSIKMRDAVVGCIKEVNANWDKMSDDEKHKKLTFIVAGGGPTGVEVSGAFAELTKDFFSKNEYKRLAPFLNIKIVEMANKLLPIASDKVSEYAKYILSSKAGIEVMLETKLKSVSKDSVTIEKKGGVEEVIPYGVFVWASGASPNSFTKQICEKVEEQTFFKKAILVNERLQVHGIPNAYALGDCALVRPSKLADRSKEIYQSALKSSFGPTVNYLKNNFSAEAFPQMFNLSKAENLPKNDEILSEENLKTLLEKLDSMYRSPPPTAQGASQQGEYLVNLFNNYPSENEKQKCPAFIYNWKGATCYIYDDNIVFYTPFGSMLGGYHTQFIWRLAYTTLNPSSNSRILLSRNWFNPFKKFIGGYANDEIYKMSFSN
ncbi:mitochondrial NADH dehydrogenase [Cryptosporidium ubiquitum]|uniref:NADH:ubiquinone reductase (non-electrogenic) n=1 Tax=Cryptosporidium ubiquitum TaxID=857276 RepID=A0A1J4MIK5_9CRYT|nr:mitochondrial NADH dehydrogenase [Cryptosporidium ubiquitum]OII74065.1 mitochondrial NADH dehydrogenase [Cryptosporidium ubiquitum]